MIHYYHFLKTALATNLKLCLSLKISFLITIFISIAKQLLFLVAWSFFFDKYKVIDGWNFEALLLMSGVAAFSMGFVELFFFGLREMPRYVETGQLDIFLLQPKNLLLNIPLSKGDMLAISELASGILLMIFSGYLQSSFLRILAILPMTILFIFSLYLYIDAVSFFLKNATGFIRELYQNATIVITQPHSAFRGLFKIFTLTLLPTSFISFFPIEFVRTQLWHYLWISYIGIFLFFLIALSLLKKGLKRYDSGSFMFHRY